MPLGFPDLIDISGTISFAIAGAFAAMERKLDPFGVLVIAFITAIGGGTIRDLLIGDLPVAWLSSTRTGWTILAGGIAAMFFGRRLKQISKLLSFFDALGLGLFTMIGIQKGLDHGLSVTVCIGLGTITGSFGGVLRDVFLNKVPLVFQKEIYASASIAGGAIYFLLLYLNIMSEAAGLVAIVLIVVIRMLALRFNWHLPVFYGSKHG
jgi:uncharacterized membrane protein YeiH